MKYYFIFATDIKLYIYKSIQTHDIKKWDRKEAKKSRVADAHLHVQQILYLPFDYNA